jgi:cell division protein FtsI (penicillin-binding protein 3)
MTNNRRKKQAQKVRQQETAPLPSYRARRWSLMTLLWAAFSVLVWRAVDQQIFETDFLQQEGQRRHLRVMDVSAHRGMIRDRRGEPLAISTPVESVWANPRRFKPSGAQLVELSRALGRDAREMFDFLRAREDRSFVYLMRRVNPDVARQVMDLVEKEQLQGIGLQREYRRYYPSGEVFSQVIGFTNIDDQGQEGVELAYDEWLQGTPGSKRVIRDGRARAVKDVENIKAPKAGKDLMLSLDWRLQYLAYRELKAAVSANKALSGSAVILDVQSGEVLAMVNQPSYNPNDFGDRRGARLRNRSMTDLFEPGSTMKPFTVAAALEMGKIKPNTRVNTSPGSLRVGDAMITDPNDYGTIDVPTVIRKSSNVGMSKIALDLPGQRLMQMFHDFGFGSPSSSGFPGERNGFLKAGGQTTKLDRAMLSFGYGISVTSLQLARAYAVLAADGIQRPVSLMALDRPPRGERVLSAETTRQVRKMLESVVSRQGTAPQAAIKGYRVAGKTGTAKKSIKGGYADDRFIAVFAGMVPVEKPRLVMVVMVDEPSAGEYYGGQVAAPVFSKVMSGALRILNIPPDFAPDQMQLAGRTH